MAGSKVRIGEIEVEFEEHGRGPSTLVLVHGFTGARSDFESHFAELARDRRVVAADHRGHGGSTNTGDAAGYTLDALTADLAGFLDARVAAPADVLGHSMGGMVALRLALARPDLVRSLILMDTAAEAARGLDPPPDIDALVRAHGVRRVLEFAAQGPERTLTVERKGADWVARDAERRLGALDPEAFVALLPLVFRGESLLDRVSEIRVPTTVLVGSLDALFLPPSRRLTERIPGARLEVIEGAYHSPQHTHPEEWLACVRRHLERVEAAA